MSGADLEHMLLEAAGRTGASRRNKQSSHKRHRGDNGSDSKDEGSDVGHATRKLSGSQVPLKKRPKNREDVQGTDADTRNRGGSSEDSDVGSDLYKDEKDREELSKLTELDRELILADRASKKDDRKLHQQMRTKLISETNTQSVRDISLPASSHGVRSSARYADRSAAKADALNELRARRMKREPEGKPRTSNDHHGLREYSLKTNSSGSDSDSENASDSQSDDVSTGGGTVDYSDDEGDQTFSTIPTYEQIKSITIRRSRLIKWLMEPFFEELMTGCFVRIGIGVRDGRSIYRLCIVRNVDATDPNKRYTLENKTTYKYLNCVWGSDRSAARWQISRASDSPPTLQEYNEWKREVERCGGHMPHTKEVQEKIEAIGKTNSYVYSAEAVKHMLQEKKSVSTRPLNIAAEKERLRREWEIADYRGEIAEVERIKARLLELEKTQQSHEKDAKALRLLEMNRKNRQENFRISSMKPANRSLKPGDAGYDPFSRRWTRSTNYYSALQEDKVEKTAEGGSSSGDGSGSKATDSKDSENTGFSASAAALEAAAGAGKLVDTYAPVDKGTEINRLHNFDLPISLERLQSLGGAQGAKQAYLARKSKIEATIGVKAPEDDGKAHPYAISISDYKRRRGLL